MDALDPNSLSELESLSDSDWLDISSRASEDTDSVAAFDDSDREDVDNRPPSRRSYSSMDSSRDGDVQGWEGYVEDSSDGSPPDDIVPADSVPLSAAALASIAEAFHPDCEDPEEEQRVKDGLDQSMMSTLSSSRSNSLNASVQTSIVHSRDLRLSFPDPLTSSRTKPLNSSYEDVSIPSDSFTKVPHADADAQAPDSIANTLTPSAADPGSVTTPEVSQDDRSSEAGESKTSLTSIDFYVVLYGVSPAAKWPLVYKLLEKLAHGTSITLSSSTSEQETVYSHVSFSPRGQSREKRVISVIDRTVLLDGSELSDAFLDRPSLAVVFLPATITILPDHTLYLPVLTQALSVVDLPYRPDYLLDAEQQWESCGIPDHKVVRLTRGSSSVIEIDDLEHARPSHVSRALRPLLVREVGICMQRLRSTHALTIFAVLSIVLGCVIKGSFTSSTGTSISQQQTTSSALWGLLRPTTAPVTTSPANHSNSLASASIKDSALAVVHPASSVATTSVSRLYATPASPGNHAVVTGAPSECNCGCGLITWPGKFESTNDLALRPTPSVPSLRAEERNKVGLSLISAQPHGKGKGKGKAAEESLYALSTRLAGTLSEYFYFDAGTLAAAARRDLQDILDALEELVRAIGRQTAPVWDQSKGIARALRAEVAYRHGRARDRARELKALGERVISSVSGHVRERTARAKQSARALRDSVAAMDVWTDAARARRMEALKLRRLARERRHHRQGMRRLRL